MKNIKRRTRKHKEGNLNCLLQNTAKGYSQVFLDGNHKYFWSKKVFSKHIENNPGPSYAQTKIKRERICLERRCI